MKTKLFFTFALLSLMNSAFAINASCSFKDGGLEGVESLALVNGTFVINNEIEIPLEETEIRCGALGKKSRLDGVKEGFQVVLKSCSLQGNFEGHIIDSAQQVSADISCDSEE